MTDDEPYLIKRYSNRKLYDSVRRRFTTLDEISDLLDSGVRVLVRDHDVGTDRTDEVLAQVLRRQAQSGTRPSSLLADLLRGPGGVAQAVVGGIVPQVGASEPAPAKPKAKAAGAKASGKKPGKSAKPKPATAKSGGKKAAKASDDGDRRDEEIRELRDQVSQLTEAVTLLLKDKTEEASRKKG